jgi:hypothetical protein
MDSKKYHTGQMVLSSSSKGLEQHSQQDNIGCTRLHARKMNPEAIATPSATTSRFKTRLYTSWSAA